MQHELTLPPAPLRTREVEGRTQVFDPLRRRYVALTPEEYVRQHFVHFLTSEKGYPTGCIANEVPLLVGQIQKRCDTVIYGREAKPLVIIEYKAPTVAITQKVFDQTWRYNIPLRVPYIIISNGRQHFCCHIDYENGKTEFLTKIPEYGDIVPETTR